jgi:threonine dehydratase
MITLADITDASARIAPYLRRTVTVRNDTLSKRLGTNLYLKLELFQKAGSFKPRAAFSKMLRMSPEELSRGVVAVSGGNFAQGVAYAGMTLGVPTTILMPEWTPANYLEATLDYGANVELTPDIQAAFDLAEEYTRQGRIFLHPFDDPDIMAGSGGVGLELMEDVPNVTDVIVSVGGGGLLTGVTTAVKSLRPEARIWSVETEGADALARSLQAGHVVRMQPSSLARTLGAPYVAADALAVAREQVEEHILVSDQEAYQAQRFLIERAKIVPELAASCTLAAAYHLQDRFSEDSHVVLVICGGNVSLDDLVEYRNRFE